MVLHFTADNIIETTDLFMGAFIHQDSYLELLAQAESLFGIQLRTTPEIPLVENSYMLMTRDPRKVWPEGLGRKLSFTVNSLMYNPSLRFIVALVHLDKNITINKIPHVVLVHDDTINNASINLLLEHSLTNVRKLEVPIKIRGRLGTMTDSGFELLPRDRVEKDGIVTDFHKEPVMRPEVSHSVEWRLPNNAPTIEQMQRLIVESERIDAKKRELLDLEKILSDRERNLSYRKEMEFTILETEINELRTLVRKYETVIELQTQELQRNSTGIKKVDKKVALKNKKAVANLAAGKSALTAASVEGAPTTGTETPEKAETEPETTADGAEKAADGTEKPEKEEGSEDELTIYDIGLEDNEKPKIVTQMKPAPKAPTSTIELTKRRERAINMTYNGHPLYEGRGGGRYFYSNGKRKYISDISPSNPYLVYSIRPVENNT